MNFIELIDSNLSYVATALSVFALFWINNLLGKINSIKRTIDLSKGFKGSYYEPTQPTVGIDLSKISQLERSVKDLADKVQKFEIVPEPTKTSDPEIKEVITTLNELPIAETKVNDTLSNDVKYYAKFPDSESGFSDNALTDRQNGEQVYELDLSLDTNEGTFYISESPGVQNYAMSDLKRYLPQACTYLNEPGRFTEISTKEAGTLRKSGNVWVIIDKVQIEFV